MLQSTERPRGAASRGEPPAKGRDAVTRTGRLSSVLRGRTPGRSSESCPSASLNWKVVERTQAGDVRESAPGRLAALLSTAWVIRCSLRLVFWCPSFVSPCPPTFPGGGRGKRPSTRRRANGFKPGRRPGRFRQRDGQSRRRDERGAVGVWAPPAHRVPRRADRGALGASSASVTLQAAGILRELPHATSSPWPRSAEKTSLVGGPSNGGRRRKLLKRLAQDSISALQETKLSKVTEPRGSLGSGRSFL